MTSKSWAHGALPPQPSRRLSLQVCPYGSLSTMMPCSFSHSLSQRSSLSVLIPKMRQKLLFCFALGCQGLFVSASTCVRVFVIPDIDRILFGYSHFRVERWHLLWGPKSQHFLPCYLLVLQGNLG